MVTKSYKKQVKKGVKSGVAIKKAQAKVKLKGAAKKNPAKIKAHGKIRRGAQSVTLTGGGAYASYKKKSGAAKSFRKSFAAARKAGKKTFKWDGRSYSTAVKKAAPKKKAVAKKKPVAKKKSKKVVKKVVKNKSNTGPSGRSYSGPKKANMNMKKDFKKGTLISRGKVKK